MVLNNSLVAPDQARAHLLSVGIIRPAPDVTAIDVNAFLSSPYGAPVNAGRVAEPDKTDVPRFLNRRAPPHKVTACAASLMAAHQCRCQPVQKSSQGVHVQVCCNTAPLRW